MRAPAVLVVSLGPDDGSFLTETALWEIRKAGRLVLRTGRHGAAEVLTQKGIPFETLDDLYGAAADFEELTGLAVNRLLSAAGEGALCYAVADPCADETVAALCRALPGGIRVLPGVSQAQAAACAALSLGMDVRNYHAVSAAAIPFLRPAADTPAAVTEIDGRNRASEVKLWLSDLFDDEMEICFLENAGAPCPQGRRIPLCEMDRQPFYDHRTAVLVPAVSYLSRQRATYEDLVAVVNRLREPGGCPWDRAQTHHTLRRYLIEEACEAADAMEREDPYALADELGDVLLQVVLNSRIAAEHRAFTDRDVTTAVVRKMVSRHPHVFGGARADSAQAVPGLWEEMKRKERSAPEEETAADRMRAVPAALPALMRAQKVQKRQLEAAGKKAEAGEALRALRACLSDEAGPDEAGLGAALEALCRYAEAKGLDAETALRAATDRRIRREETRTRNEACGRGQG